MSSRTNTPIWRTALTLKIMFWAGVACAPLAALVLLVASSEGTVKFALMLGLACVVLIGLSVTWRRDASSVERELVTALADVEADTHRLVAELRAEMRQLNRGGEPRPVGGREEPPALDRGRRSPAPGPRARAAVEHQELPDGGLLDAPDRPAPYGRSRARDEAREPVARHDPYREPEPMPRGQSGRSGRSAEFDARSEADSLLSGLADDRRDDHDRYREPAGNPAMVPRQRGGRHDDLRDRRDRGEAEQRDWRGAEREPRAARRSAGPEDGWQAGGERRSWSTESEDRRGRHYDESGSRHAIGAEEAEQQTRWSEYEEAAGRKQGGGMSYMDEFYGDGRR